MSAVVMRSRNNLSNLVDVIYAQYAPVVKHIRTFAPITIPQGSDEDWNAPVFSEFTKLNNPALD